MWHWDHSGGLSDPRQQGRPKILVCCRGVHITNQLSNTTQNCVYQYLLSTQYVSVVLTKSFTNDSIWNYILEVSKTKSFIKISKRYLKMIKRIKEKCSKKIKASRNKETMEDDWNKIVFMCLQKNEIDVEWWKQFPSFNYKLKQKLKMYCNKAHVSCYHYHLTVR